MQSPPQLVLSSFALRSASGGTAIERGERFSADLVVTNSGQATAAHPIPYADQGERGRRLP